MDGDAERGLGRALADARLEHPELAALDGELDVAHVAVVPLEARHDVEQVVVGLAVDLGHVGQRHRVADAGDDVLALRVLQVVAVDALLAAGRVAGEGDPGAGVHAEVAEDHRLHVDRRAEVLGDPLLAAVEPRAVGVPGLEDRPDREVHLLTGVLGEVVAGLLLDDRLEPLDQCAQVVGAQVEVGLGAEGALGLVERLGEELAVDVEHRAAEHLEQATVGVEGEALVGAARGEAADRLVVEADVEDRLHHPGHGELRTRAHRHEQRVGGVTQAPAHRGLEPLEVLGDLLGEPVGLAALTRLLEGEVGPTGLGGDREARWHREPEVRHLGEVGPLAAEKVLLVLAAL